MMSLMLLGMVICVFLGMGVVIAVIVIWAQNRQIGEQIDQSPPAPRPVGLERAPQSLQAEVDDLLLAGAKIEAIKRYRQATGLGLKEAKDAVEARQRGEPLLAPAPISWDAPDASRPEMSPNLEAEIGALMRQGNKLAAITQYRAATGSSLLEAKNAVEALENGQPLPLPNAAQAGDLPPVIVTNLEEQVANLLRQDRKIDAIKIYRAATNQGLVEAKEAVEAIERRLLG